DEDILLDGLLRDPHELRKAAVRVIADGMHILHYKRTEILLTFLAIFALHAPNRRDDDDFVPYVRRARFGLRNFPHDLVARHHRWPYRTVAVHKYFEVGPADPVRKDLEKHFALSDRGLRPLFQTEIVRSVKYECFHMVIVLYGKAAWPTNAAISSGDPR